jgi:hypothetical protein
MSDNCVINPLTNRPIKKGGAIYNKLLKKGLLDNAEKDCVVNEKTGRAVRASGKVGKEVIKRDAGAKIAGAIKRKLTKKLQPPKPKSAVYKKAKKVPVIKDKEDTPFVDEPTTVTGKYNLPNRVNFINKVKTLVKDIKDGDCIEPKKFGDNDGYTVRDIINLEKRIGTESAYGVIYLTTIAGASNNYKIASKLFGNNGGNRKEIEIMDFLTEKMLLTQKNRHFLALYNKTACLDKKLKPKMRLLSINELAHGDLKTLVETESVMSNDKLVINLYIQTMISIASFHKATKYYHGDAHWGNFLYQKNVEKGYYHYRNNNTDYYLEASDYTIMIYDFGLAKKIKKGEGVFYENSQNVIGDYVRINYAFFNEDQEGWCKGNFISEDLSDTMITSVENLMDINSRDNNMEIPDEVIGFLNAFFPDVFMTKRPPNVINKIPFEI